VEPIAERVVCGVEVVDGDTIRLPDGAVVRLLGIDCPETGRPCAALATTRLQELLEGRCVALEREHSDRDRYGRMLRHVWRLEPDGSRTLVEELLLREGLARATPYPPDTARATQLRAAESAARALQRGLWAVTPDAVFYIGSRNKYHRAECENAARIKRPVRFATREAAAESGRRPARCCNP
jgi:endonuclease YncB( thermonuclease family)